MSDLLIPLVTFALVATCSPGGATTLATASVAQFGYVRSLPLMAGIAVGLGVLVGSVAGGLATVIQSLPQLQFWLRLAGSAYLLWLAWMIGRQGAPGSKIGAPAIPIGFIAGLLMLWTNPKGWTMAAAAAAAYGGLSSSPIGLGLIVCAAFVSAAAVSLSLWCLGGQWLARLLTTDTKWRAANICLGLLLAGSIIPMWR